MQEIIKSNDATGQVSKISLTGFTRQNTDEMRLYVSVEYESPDYFVRMFKDSSRSLDSLVASGSATEGAAVVALAESGSSGISGSAKLDYVVDDSQMEILLGYADISDLLVYESGLEALLPSGAADFYPQQNEAFFQVNRILRARLRDELSACDGVIQLDLIADKRPLARAQIFYALYLIYNDRAARIDDSAGPYAAARDEYFSLFGREMASVSLMVDSDRDGKADMPASPGSAKIGRA